MLPFVLAFLGGALTILSPCVLPVIPFVFARSDRPFRQSGLFTLIGMAITFALLASVATVGGAWVVRANQVGRWVAMLLLGILGLSMLFPAVGNFLTRPFVTLGNRLLGGPSRSVDGPGGSLLVGVAAGFLWAPCAGPILGLILTGAALSGVNARTVFLLLTFAAGAAVSLGLATLAGSRVIHALKRGLGAEEWIRRGLGATVLIAVIAVAFGWDKGLLTELSLGKTDRIEHKLVERLAGGPATSASPSGTSTVAGSRDRIPDLSRATGWINSAALDAAALRGRVVLLDVWTYSCINCLRTIPFVRTWAERYADAGLVVIGIHAPEFAFERDPDNVRRAVRDLGIRYPVALDNKFAIWRALENHYWPAQFLVDTSGVIRFREVGEGHEREMEQRIRALLAESGQTLPEITGGAGTRGGALAPRSRFPKTPETYVGYARAAGLVSPEAVRRDEPQVYSSPAELDIDRWSLSGEWTVGKESAVAARPGASIRFHFRGRDLHLVMGPTSNERSVRFRVLLDGAAVMDARGSDVMLDGTGTVTSERLYQLVRSRNDAGPHTFEIEFLDGGVAVYAFTFG